MRSNLDSRIAGEGTLLAFYEEEETYRDNRAHVILPNDPETMKKDKFDAFCESVASEVKIYYLEKTKNEQR